MKKEELKKVIFEAFKDVQKGDGLGVRECDALDSYAPFEKVLEAREKDIEQHWWEYPDDLKAFSFSYALTYNNKNGIKFHLPALMTSIIDGKNQQTSEISVYRVLCEEDFAERSYDQNNSWPPHPYHHEYLQFLKGIKINTICAYYEFSPEQIHAIGLYLLWFMHEEAWVYFFFDTREAQLNKVKQDMANIPADSIKKGYYNLTLEEAIAIMDEQHRIVKDWLNIGNVNTNEKFE